MKINIDIYKSYVNHLEYYVLLKGFNFGHFTCRNINWLEAVQYACSGKKMKSCNEIRFKKLGFQFLEVTSKLFKILKRAY